VASSRARELLHAHLGTPEQGKSAAGLLWRALATYGLRLIAMIGGFALAWWLADRGGDGVLGEAPALAGRRELTTGFAALAVLVGVGTALFLAIWPVAHLAGVGTLVQLVALLWCPLLAVLLCDQAGAPGWAVAAAAVPAWTMLSAPRPGGSAATSSTPR
jgi:hypothetical protein